MSEDENIHIGDYEGEPFTIPLARVLTGRTAVIGMSGSGKSHTVGVLCEELAEAGYPFIVIDPEGEYHSLKEAYEVLWACRSDEADVRLNEDAVRDLAVAAATKGARMVFDTSESRDEFLLVSAFLEEFYKVQTKVRDPILLIVEEADRFAPQSGGEVIDAMHEISRRGRKRGIGLIIATQRPAMVDKNVLSQCGNQMIGRLRSKNDQKAVDLFFQDRRNLKRLPGLGRGKFFVMGDIARQPALVDIKDRRTKHGGATPRIKGKKAFRVDDVLRDMGRSAGSAREPTRQLDEVEDETEDTGPRGVVVDSVKKGSAKGRKGEVKKGKTSVSTGGRKNGPSRPETISYRGLPFNIDREGALRSAQKEMKKSITGKLKESIENAELVLWPMLDCRVEQARRGITKLKVGKYNVLWDAAGSAFLKVRGSGDLLEMEVYDPRVAHLRWKEVRVMRELSGDDMTIEDLAPRTGLSVGEVRGAVTSLNRKDLLTDAGKAGRAKMYRPLIDLRVVKLKEIHTTKVPYKSVEAPPDRRRIPVLAPREAVENIIEGLHEGAKVTASELFYFPFCLVNIRDRKKGTSRTLVVNGVTGSDRELEGNRVDAVLR